MSNITNYINHAQDTNLVPFLAPYIISGRKIRKYEYNSFSKYQCYRIYGNQTIASADVVIPNDVGPSIA